MMVKLNMRNHTCRHYDAPFEIQRNFDDPSDNMTNEEVVNHLLWIPALVTARFLGQFQFLKSEADERSDICRAPAGALQISWLLVNTR